MSEKTNYWSQKISAQDASIIFGGISPEKDVRSSFMVKALDGRHFLTMDQDGQRKGWTTLAGPGNFTVEAGDDNKKTDLTIMFNSKNGDISIVARDGNIRLEGNNIELVARGEGGSAGNIICTATENFVIKNTKKILMDSSSFFRLSTTGTGEVVANTCLSIYGSIIKGVTDAVAVKNSKNTNQKFQRKCTGGN